MPRTLILLAFLLIGIAQASRAADVLSQLPLCPDWSGNVETDFVLWQALDTAYPNAKVDPDEEPSRLTCLFPYKLLSYDKFVVLITLEGEPGQGCHGCAAQVSAVFLQRDGNKLKPSSRHDVFDETGTFGDLMSIHSFRLGAEDGLVVEGGGTFQGYSYSALSLFRIRSGRMKPIHPASGISSGDSDCGAHDEPCRSVDGHWRVEGRRFIVRYIGAREDGTKVDGDVVYELRKGSLVRISGHKLAKEMKENRP